MTFHSNYNFISLYIRGTCAYLNTLLPLCYFQMKIELTVNRNDCLTLPWLQVAEKLKLGAKTAIDIDKLRDGYRPAAKLGAVLFFVLSEMSAVNSMYQYSLASYLQQFDLSLRKSLPDSILPKRLKNIMDTLTMNVYNYACTGERKPCHMIRDILSTSE